MFFRVVNSTPPWYNFISRIRSGHDSPVQAHPLPAVFILQNIKAHTSRYYKNHPKAAKDKPPRLPLNCKRTKNACRGWCSSQYVKGRPPMLSACQGTAIQIANFIQMKGTDAFRVLSRAVCAFVRRWCCYCSPLQRVRFLPSFAVIVCAWVRLCALARCLRLFICRLRGFYCFCNTLSALHAFARLCGLYCSRVWLVI